MRALLLFLSIWSALLATGQSSLSEQYKALLTPPAEYLCAYATSPIVIDGKSNDPAWKNATWTADFQDISGAGFATPRYRTRAKMLWTTDTFYVYAEMEEPHLWSNLKERDTIVYHDNDFEVFIEPRNEARPYFEFEVNQRGTLFDLCLEGAYRAPKRPFIQFQWNAPGLRYALHLDGTLNDASDVDKGWSIEMAIPAKDISAEFHNFLQAFATLRVNFSRVQWHHEVLPNGHYRRKMVDGKVLPEDNWVWTPTGQVTMHMPERWGYVRLLPAGGADQGMHIEDKEKQEASAFLWMLFYAQEEQYGKHRKYHQRLADFRLTKADQALLPKGWAVRLETTSHTYEIIATSPSQRTYVIDESGCYFQRK